VLPPLDDLLLCRRIENKVEKTNTAKNTKNSVDDIDQEDIPLQVFIRDFVEGQTYAIELAFSIDGTHARQQIFPVGNGNEGHEHWSSGEPNYMFSVLVHKLRTRFLTSNVKAMMGYVFNQANIYSFKGERLNCAREFRELLLKGFTDTDAGDDQLQDFVDLDKPIEMADGGTWLNGIIFKDEFAKLAAKYPKYFRIDEYDIGGKFDAGRMRPCFMVLEKTFPWTNTLNHSLIVADTLINKYGSRANQASEQNVDWKAMMHAVRIVDEGLELLQHKKITLPRPPADVARLLQIKQGELPLEPLKEELVTKLELLKNVSATCGLPSSSDPDFKQELEKFTLAHLRRFYAL
jgi:hypothetical protein